MWPAPCSVSGPLSREYTADTLTAAVGDRQAERLLLRGADHNTVFSVDTQRLREAIHRLLDRVRATDSTASTTQPARG